MAERIINPSGITPEDSYTLGVSSGEAPLGLVSKSLEHDPLSKESLKKLGEAYFISADTHRRPRDQVAEIAWKLYNNEYDFSQKAWWQHKAPIPKVRTAVDRAVALFRKTLLRMYPFYSIQAESKLGRTKGRYTMLLTDYHLDQSMVIDEMVKAFKVGLITSVASVKIWWERVRDFKPEVTSESTEVPRFEFGIQTGFEQETTRKVELKEFFKGKLGVKAINPQFLWIIPGTNNRGFIERDEATLNEIEKLASEGIYDEEEVELLRDKLLSATTKTEDQIEQTTEGKPEANAYMRHVDLWHYWCDIYDTQGKLIMADANFTLAAGRSVCIRDARPNPFFHKDAPYIVGTPYTVPFSTYHRGMVEDIAEIAKSIVEMANLVADGALYDAMKAFSVDADQLDDPAEARLGVYPGKTFIRRSSQGLTPNEQLVQTIDVGKVPAEAMNMIALFERYFQEGSFINEWVTGFGSAGGRTLGEVNQKTQSALEGLDESARNLEITLIEPGLTMISRVLYQFHSDYLLQRLMDNYPQVSMMLQELSPEERYATMVGDYSFKVRGLSMMIDRQQRIGELKEILTLLSYLPGFLEQLDPAATLEEILMPIGWDPRRLLLNNSGNQVTTPGPGAAPQEPRLALPPGGGGGANGSQIGNNARNPMQQRNAAEGARMGGATNNPVGGGRPDSGQIMAMLSQMQGRRA